MLETNVLVYMLNKFLCQTIVVRSRLDTGSVCIHTPVSSDLHGMEAT